MFHLSFLLQYFQSTNYIFNNHFDALGNEASFRVHEFLSIIIIMDVLAKSNTSAERNEKHEYVAVTPSKHLLKEYIKVALPLRSHQNLI